MGNSATVQDSRTIFDFEVEDINNQKISLSTYKGKKAYVIVNTASTWGLADQSFSEFQQLYSKYSEKGFEILAFPCNSFKQEPLDNAGIVAYTRGKGATFPILGKIACEEGANTAPLYQYLRDYLSGGLTGKTLKWNYTKFLCNAEGIPIRRLGPLDNPLSFEKDIVKLLEK